MNSSDLCLIFLKEKKNAFEWQNFKYSSFYSNTQKT